MNASYILLTTNRFNLSVVKPHFINPCCFGEDFASWLGSKLTERGIRVSPPGQEDWGWYLTGACGPDSYFLGVSGNAGANDVSSNEGEWRITIQKRQSIWQKLSGKGKITATDTIVQTVEAVLRSDSEFRDIHFEN